jgi:hypothetical protein
MTFTSLLIAATNDIFLSGSTWCFSWQLHLKYLPALASSCCIAC